MWKRQSRPDSVAVFKRHELEQRGNLSPPGGRSDEQQEVLNKLLNSGINLHSSLFTMGVICAGPFPLFEIANLVPSTF